MFWTVGIIVLAFLALVVDRIALWAERKGWIYWRMHRRNHPREAATGAIDELHALLSPAYRHTVAEADAKRMSRVDQATGEDVGVSVDLDSGVVRLSRS
ncbi:DUF6191 domain-containing protein [Rhodococcus sp. NPDC058521]|uniref:DUF6191 domain-containing protein n=1 Tax=Rhodococcus sp. NPDC058521 TaxID=3346536 RepID=UPI00365C1339